MVKGLYTNARTQYKTLYGHTEHIGIGRGTIQGDTLSPFLFLTYIEPLLRWLNVGCRGYRFGAAHDSPDTRWQAQTACSSLAYADDLEILTSTLTDLKMQAEKLTKYAENGTVMESRH